MSIGGALQEMLQAQGLGFLMHENRLRQRWVDVVGEKLETIAMLESFKNGVVCIQVADATWRNELHYQRDVMKHKANQVLGSSLVKEVRLR